MNCTNCSTELPEGAKVCPVCGAKTEYSEEPIQPKPPKKSKNGLIIGICVAAVLLLAIVGTVLAVVLLNKGNEADVIDDNVEPEVQYRDVEDKFIKDTAVTVASYVDVVKLNVGKADEMGPASAILENKQMENEISVKIDDSIANAVSSMAGIDLSFIQDMGIDIDVANKDGANALEIGIRTEENKLLSLQLTLDPDGSTAYLTVPQLNKTALKLDYEATVGGYTEEYMQPEVTAVVYNTVDAFPEGSRVEEYLVRYLGIALEQIETAQRERVTVGTENTNTECAAFTVTVNEELLERMATAMLTEAKEDEQLWADIEAVLDAIDPVLADETDFIRAGINNELDTYIAKVDGAFEGFGELVYTTYSDAEYNIIGREVVYDGNRVLAYCFDEENNYASRILVEEGNSTRFDLICEGSITDGLYNGKISVSTADQAIGDIVFTMVDAEALEKGAFSGKIEVTPSPSAKALLPFAISQLEAELGISLAEYGIKTDDLHLTVEGKTEAACASYSITLFNGEEALIALAFDSSISDAEAIALPEGAADLTNQFEALAWVFGIDINGFVDNLPDGLEESAKELIAEALTSSLQ